MQIWNHTNKSQLSRAINYIYKPTISTKRTTVLNPSLMVFSSSSWNPIKLRNKTILKEVTDCEKAVDDFLTGNLNFYIWFWFLFTELRNCSKPNVDFDRCQCIAAVNASNFAFVKVKQIIWSMLYTLHTSQIQECSLKAYKDESVSRKTTCKKAVGNCKTAAVKIAF